MTRNNEVGLDAIEGRNPVIECLTRGRRMVRKILLDSRAKPDGKVQKIQEEAGKRGVPVLSVERAELDRRADGRVHNGVIAYAEPIPTYTMKQAIDSLLGKEPFLVACDEVQYEHNLGAILRSALGFGVDAVILPTRRGAELSPVVQRVAMGAAEVVPVVREGLHSALAVARRAGIRVVGADMDGKPLGQIDLTGPIVILVGGETGLSPSLRERCDEVVSIPLHGGLESLNMSVAAAILLYEKRRQDGWFGNGDAPP